MGIWGKKKFRLQREKWRGSFRLAFTIHQPLPEIYSLSCHHQARFSLVVSVDIDSMTYWIPYIENIHNGISEIAHARLVVYDHDGFHATKDQVSLLFCAADICPVPHP